MLVDSMELNDAADDLRQKCVEGLGSGGYHHGIQECKGPAKGVFQGAPAE